jgi:hypothetical protein
LSSTPSFALRIDVFPPAMIACTSVGSVPKVGGISADSSTPRRPLVPAPTKTMRPPFRSADTIMSTPVAMRAFSFWTAASILRSSLIISSTISSDCSLSIARVAELMASVGSDSNLERWGIEVLAVSLQFYRLRAADSVSRLPPPDELHSAHVQGYSTS